MLGRHGTECNLDDFQRFVAAYRFERFTLKAV